VLIVEDIPKSALGKVQRLGLAEKLGLLASAPVQPVRHTAFVAPRTPVEERLAGLWAQVPNLERVGLHDDFFQLGGDSLLAVQLLSCICEAMHVEVSLTTLFETPTVADMAGHIETTSQAEPAPQVPSLRPMPRDEALPLSYAQQRLWFLEQMGLSGQAYTLLEAMRLSGPLHVVALEQSLREIVRRHEILHTTFLNVEGQPRQVIAPVPALSMVELQAGSRREREVQMHTLEREEAERSFDLAQGPLVRATLVRLDAEEHVLLLTMHHIVSDGWSYGVFWRELGLLYKVYAMGKPSPLPALPLQYADFAVWQQQWFQGARLASHLAYWAQRLAGHPAMLELPTDYPRPPVQGSRGACQSLLLPARLSAALKALSRQAGVTLFMTLLAVFKVFLYRHTRQEDILVGSPITDRSRVETEGLIGCFVNTLVLRTDLSGSPTFRELLNRVRETCLGAYAYQELNRRANKLAHVLRTLGVGPDVLVGIYLERSLEMVVGLLGVLKAGGAYVPLDPAYPHERLVFMLEDSQASVLLTQQRMAAPLPVHRAQGLCLDAEWPAMAQADEGNPPRLTTGDNLAYVIYTSGSTGQPKGVMIAHSAIGHCLFQTQAICPLTATDRVLQRAPCSFDTSVWEFFGPLVVGAQVLMTRPEQPQDSAYLMQLMTAQQVTILQLVPSILRVLLETEGLATCGSLRRVICGGEELSVELQERYFVQLGVDLHNFYGTTEATINATQWSCERGSHRRIVPIGRPMGNTQIYVLDAQLQPVPIGVPGELYIGGAGLARGYLNNPELTAEKFIPNPYSHAPAPGCIKPAI
jgi:amino acid adenylation domain-containing protein